MPAAGKALSVLLPAYPRLRAAQARRLAALFAASPFAGSLTVEAYYRARLGLALRSLDLHGRALRPGEAAVEGRRNYLEAAASGRPVALLGLHLGVVELLHRIPEAAPGRPFGILTAPGFSRPLTAFMRRGRERDGKHVLPNRGMGPGLRALTRGKGVLAAMADQAPGPAGTCLDLWDRIRVPYPARLLEFLGRHDFRLVPVATRLEADGTSTFRFGEPFDAGGGAAGRVRAFLEEGISWAPDQWNWSYPKVAVAVPGSRGRPVPGLRGRKAAEP